MAGTRGVLLHTVTATCHPAFETLIRNSVSKCIEEKLPVILPVPPKMVGSAEGVVA